MWIDSHCHLDAAEFDADREMVRAQARAQGVSFCVIPAVEAKNFDAVKRLAERFNDMYALGIHPLYVPSAKEEDLMQLEQAIEQAQYDRRLVAIGEIGLDYFVPDLMTQEMREKQWHFYLAQLGLAKKYKLPVILHVRKSTDMLLKGIRQLQFSYGGIAHAFNGSKQQADALTNMGFKLGFGGTLTFERSLQIRQLAKDLPLEHIVLETDAPDIPPTWLYVPAEQRQAGKSIIKNSPAELPRIGEVLASLRQTTVSIVAIQTSENVKKLFWRFFVDEPLMVSLDKS